MRLARCASARKLGTARLHGIRLAWHKFGCDATGKCAAAATGCSTVSVHGLAWMICDAERASLEFHEELGTGDTAEYVRIQVRGRIRAARTYMAIPLDSSLRPLGGYKHFVVEGAREHRLPPDWRAFLSRAPMNADDDAARRNRNLKIGRSRRSRR